MNAFKIILLIALFAYGALAQATFKPREERWAQQIQEYLMVGEIQWLTDAPGRDGKTDKFLSIYTAPSGDAQGRATAKGSAIAKGSASVAGKSEAKGSRMPGATTAKGAVILMHGEGRHPDWPEVISPLRRGLAEQGYATLSLQMPVLPRGGPLSGYGRALDEAAPRIQAGMKFLRDQGHTGIVLIGYGVGAAMGMGALTQGAVKGVRGFIGVGMAAHVSEKPGYLLDPRLHAPTMLNKLRLPVLDIYGGFDDKVVTQSAPERAAAAERAGNQDYTQYKIADADHGFGRFEKELLRRVGDWLDERVAAPSAAREK